MPQGWEWYLPDVPTENISRLLRECGIPEPDAEPLTQGVLETAALCRLAFSSLQGTTERLPRWSCPAEAIISQTQYGMQRGRPRTARWAVWAAYILCEELNMQGKQLSYRFIGKLVGVLLDRTMPPGEVKRIFVGLQREAEAHATAAAHALLENNLKKDWSPKTFAQWITGMFGEGLLPTSEMPPMIDHGRVSDQWLQDLLNTRRAILQRVKQYGSLARSSPLVWVSSTSRILTGLPLGGSPGPGGSLHFGKALEVPTPSVPFEGGTTTVSIPRRLLDSPPYAAVLYAVPVYWHQWQGLFVARAKRIESREGDGKETR